MARPRKPPTERADQQMGVRFTATERAQLERLMVALRLRSAAEVIKVALWELAARVEGEEQGQDERLDRLEARVTALEAMWNPV